MALPLAPIAIGAITALGGIIAGKDGTKTIDPNVLKKLFGPEAVTKETIELFNRMINSPQGAQMIAQANEQGSQFANALNAKLAEAGVAGGGGTSGVGAFQQAAAASAPHSLERGVRADMFANASQLAQQNIRDRMAAYVNSALQTQANPTTGQIIGGALAGAGAQSLANMALTTKAPTNQTSALAAPTSTASRVNEAFTAAPIVQRVGFGQDEDFIPKGKRSGGRYVVPAMR